MEDDYLVGPLETTSCTHILEYEKDYLVRVVEEFDADLVADCNVCSAKSSLSFCVQRECRKFFCSRKPFHDLVHFRSTDGRHSVFFDTEDFEFVCLKCPSRVTLTESLSLVETSEDSRRYEFVRGLPNLGNTCYMNSALQALVHSPPLVSFFIKYYSTDASTAIRTKEGSIALAFMHLLNCMLKKNVPPPNLLFLIKSSHPMFRGFQQHDSQEFLRCFMDSLHEEIKNVPDEKSYEPKIAESDDDGDDFESCDSDVSEKSMPFSRPVIMQEKMKYKKTECRSIINDIFDGSILSSVQCLTCNRVSTRLETFQDLSLPIPSRESLNLLHDSSQKCSHYGRRKGWVEWLFGDFFAGWVWGSTVTLGDCLSAFFSADELKGDNMYSCEKCRKLRNGVKYSKMVKTPEVLCVHLKRFRHDHMFSSKINSNVVFPMEGLDLKQFVDEEGHCGETTYRLISVICHHGSSGNGGHYTTYALNSSNGEWYHFDDMVVTKVHADTVRNCQAYVLFYSRENDNSRKYRPRKYQKMTQEVESFQVANCDED